MEQTRTIETLSQRTERVLKAKHRSPKTIKAYQHWIKRFEVFRCQLPGESKAEAQVNAFLEHLASKEDWASPDLTDIHDVGLDPGEDVLHGYQTEAETEAEA